MTPAMRSAGPGDRPADQYPQAIADDYPGWEVCHQDGRWTASCPAITVQAATAAGLRAAIEEAISPDAPA
jgi:hypothetical protein